MKQLLMGAVLFLAINANAQQKTAPAKKPVTPKTTTPAPVMKNLVDSASYAIGLGLVNFYYKQQGLKKLNTAMISKAINDIMAGKHPLLADQAANDAVMKYIAQATESKAKPNIDAGRQFLAKNKTREGVKTTTSGLQYEVITQGTGAKPTAEDSVTVNYAGTLINGTEFDNSYKRGQPITFPLNRVIKGWTEGLQLMNEGGKYKFYIPHELGYGTNDMGTIPAGSVLLFEVELLKVTPKQQ